MPVEPDLRVVAEFGHQGLDLRGFGHERRVPWPAGESLVDVLINNGHDVPYSCQSGECATCLCKLTKGTVEMAVTDGLDPDDAEDGYILGCQAKPTSPELEVEY